jgi:hypothetical protein
LSKTGFSEAADTYHVIHVNGTIQIRASGKLLEVGDKISSEDEIVFKNTGCGGWGYQCGKRAFYTQGKVNKGEKGSEVTVFVKNLLPSSRIKISVQSR